GRIRGLHPPGDRARHWRPRARQAQARARPRRPRPHGAAGACPLPRWLKSAAYGLRVPTGGCRRADPRESGCRGQPPQGAAARAHWPASGQLGPLLEACEGTPWEVPILVAVVTGARRSEILGLSWEDVDLKAGTIFI